MSKYGTTTYTDEMLEQEFWLRVLKTDGCWLWQGYLDKKGYGRRGSSCLARGQSVLVHKAAWEYVVGPVPAGLSLDHLCEVKHCCNPAHLEPCTPEENQRRAGRRKRARETHCKHGHAWTEENTIWRVEIRKDGLPSESRLCRECGNIRNRESRARKRQATLSNDPASP